jgi:hypothetical protein
MSAPLGEAMRGGPAFEKHCSQLALRSLQHEWRAIEARCGPHVRSDLDNCLPAATWEDQEM